MCLATINLRSVHLPETRQSNVLLDSAVKACVSDFGMSTIKAEFQGTSYWTSNKGGAVRWSALELYRSYEDDVHPVVTQECDIYSYGSLTLQVRWLNSWEIIDWLICTSLGAHWTGPL